MYNQRDIDEIEHTDPDNLKLISEDKLFSELGQTAQAQNIIEEPPTPEPGTQGHIPPTGGAGNNGGGGENDEDIIQDGDENDSNDPAYKGRKKGVDINIGSVIKPEFAVSLMDVIMPTIIALLLSFMEIECNKKDFSLSAQEKKVLAEPMEAMLAGMNIKQINPAWAFIMAFAGIYGSKVGEKIIEHNINESKKDAEKERFEQWAREEGYIKGDKPVRVETRGRKKKKS